MVDLKFKCVVCGKTWTRKVDEHDVKRYYQLKPDDPHPDAHCPCDPRRKMVFPNIVMDSVCNCCDD